MSQTVTPPRSPSPVMATVRYELPGTVRNDLLGGWLVPFEAGLEGLVVSSRVMRGLPPVIDATEANQ